MRRYDRGFRDGREGKVFDEQFATSPDYCTGYFYGRAFRTES